MNTKQNLESEEYGPNYYRERQRKRRRSSVWREIRSWVFCLVGAVAVALFLRVFVFEIINVLGDSMNSTLFSGEKLFVEKLTRRFGTIERGEIVIVHYPGHKDVYVKRVVGVAGDRIAVHDGALYRNGERIVEPYINTDYILSDFEEVSVAEGTVFVMGDNRNDSLDSRSVGAIPLEQLVGHALFVVAPVSSIRGLDDA